MILELYVSYFVGDSATRNLDLLSVSFHITQVCLQVIE